MEYSTDGYSTLLKKALEVGYKFINFENQLKRKKTTNDGLLLLRHDIDLDLLAATTLAEIEYGLGISATYFLMIKSPAYNLFARHNIKYTNKIISLGHKIGLHYDISFDQDRNYTGEQTYKEIQLECRLIEDTFNTKVDTVSLHQPTVDCLDFGKKTFNKLFTHDYQIAKSFKYFSDSNRGLCFSRELRNKSLEDLFPKNIQLLVHPVWWYYNTPSTIDVWNSTLMNNFSHMQKQFLETERAYGKKRKFTISS